MRGRKEVETSDKTKENVFLGGIYISVIAKSRASLETKGNGVSLWRYVIRKKTIDFAVDGGYDVSSETVVGTCVLLSVPKGRISVVYGG